jgi:hypothetical protein
MSAALLHRYEPVRYKAQAEAAREWTGFSLREMARECLEQKGANLRGKGIDEVVQLALYNFDLPNILADVANKTLRAGYENYPNTFQPFTKRGTATDFKTIYRTQLSGAPALVAGQRARRNQAGNAHRFEGKLLARYLCSYYQHHAQDHHQR